MDFWQIVVLGVIQGLTEFLPISSTAHLLVAQELMGRSREELKTDPFTVVIQVGTLVAVYWYFRSDIVKLIKGFFRDVAERRVFTSATPEGRMAKQIIVGTIPVVIIGLLFSRRLKDTFYNPQAIAWVAITFALLMAAAEWWFSRRKRAGSPERSESEITYLDALWIGCFQALALMPGGSRSGTTITAGLFAGLGRTAAARFSFLLSLPSVLAAGVKEIYDWLKSARENPALESKLAEQATAMLIGGLISAVVGYVAIAWLLRYLNTHSTFVFILYRIVLGLVILGLIARGMIEP
jgi:undecaprenyl-diphosphatase